VSAVGDGVTAAITAPAMTNAMGAVMCTRLSRSADAAKTRTRAA
jgi:hypothetical protein